MSPTDVVLKAKLNLALARDPRVGAMDIGVQVQDAVVTLNGEVDQPEERNAAEEIARAMPGVADVINEIEVGTGVFVDTAVLLSHRLQDKLEAEWSALPERTARVEADYLRWALWVIHKFHIPPSLCDAESAELEEDAKEQAIERVAGYLRAPRALVALEMVKLAEQIAEQSPSASPEIEFAPLTTSPEAEAA